MCVLRVNNPIPSNMKSEFTEISSRTGPDKLIPANILANGQGLAIITVIKADFMITAWGGRGIVIARLGDDVMGIHGVGGGYFPLVCLISGRCDGAVDSFSKGGNLTLGDNCTVSVDVALRCTAAVFTYCKVRGLFTGVSLERPCIIEHKGTIGKYILVSSFTGRHSGDLSFKPSDRITVVTKTELQYEWWEGTLNGRTGIFPANFLSYP
uniref:SH3 domain-containing protein n=1 Tax=Oncorhynchus mykiss TaxID=8022 RepID=A0A8K9WT94_ONCMY